MDMVTISDNDSNINKNVVYENYGFYDDQAETKTTTTKLDNNHNRNKNESNHHNRSSPIAVKIRNVFLSYGNHQVLKGVNMNVPVKQIYGLLGPSGCGMFLYKFFFV